MSLYNHILTILLCSENKEKCNNKIKYFERKYLTEIET